MCGISFDRSIQCSLISSQQSGHVCTIIKCADIKIKKNKIYRYLYKRYIAYTIRLIRLIITMNQSNFVFIIHMKIKLLHIETILQWFLNSNIHGNAIIIFKSEYSEVSFSRIIFQCPEYTIESTSYFSADTIAELWPGSIP